MWMDEGLREMCRLGRHRVPSVRLKEARTTSCIDGGGAVRVVLECSGCSASMVERRAHHFIRLIQFKRRGM